jgi:hypothetical protein
MLVSTGSTILAVDAGTATVIAAVIAALGAIGGAAIAFAQGWLTRPAKPAPGVSEPVREFAAKLTGATNAADEAVSYAGEGEDEVDVEELTERVEKAQYLVNEAAGLIGGVRPLVSEEAADHADEAIAELREAAKLLDQGIRSLQPGFFFHAGKALQEAQSAGRKFENAIRV